MGWYGKAGYAVWLLWYFGLEVLKNEVYQVFKGVKIKKKKKNAMEELAFTYHYKSKRVIKSHSKASKCTTSC